METQGLLTATANPVARERASGPERRLDGSPEPGPAGALHRIGVAADHGGFELMQYLAGKLRESGCDVIEFGDRQADQNDDYPDFVIPLARAVGAGELERGVAICGSGVGASVAANKVRNVRACLIPHYDGVTVPLKEPAILWQR